MQTSHRGLLWFVERAQRPRVILIEAHHATLQPKGYLWDSEKYSVYDNNAWDDWIAVEV